MKRIDQAHKACAFFSEKKVHRLDERVLLFRFFLSAIIYSNCCT